MSKKYIFSRILFGLDFVTFEKLLLKYSASRLSILAYHRVLNYDENSYPFDDEVISATPEVFENQMIFLKRHFNVINFRILNKYLANGCGIPERTVIITFDDGYSDNYDNVFPILKKHDLTATIFITTGLISKNDTFWFEKVAYWVKNTNAEILSVFNGKHTFNIKSNRRKAINDLLLLLKSVPDTDRIHLLEEIKNALNVKINTLHSPLASPLRWEQVVEMDRKGIEIGSHTVTHPVLSNLDDQSIYLELSESKNTIERILGRDVLCISYPVGEKMYYDNRVLRITERCGYKFGVTYNDSVSVFHESSKYELPRIHVEKYHDLPYFKGNILLPSVFLR